MILGICRDCVKVANCPDRAETVRLEAENRNLEIEKVHCIRFQGKP